MGIAFWLFVHIIDRADWETGIVRDWKDSDEAADMGLKTNTLRDWRQKLEKEGYISCQQTLHGQDVTIFKWVNPKEYSGKVYNHPPTDGGNEEVHGDEITSPLGSHGDVHGDVHVRGKDVTPTLYSESIPDSNKEINPYLKIIQANAVAHWGNNHNSWNRVKKILESASFERIDHTITIRGLGLKAGMFQDRYARTFEHDLLGGLNEEVSVIFEE